VHWQTCQWSNMSFILGQREYYYYGVIGCESKVKRENQVIECKKREICDSFQFLLFFYLFIFFGKYSFIFSISLKSIKGLMSWVYYRFFLWKMSYFTQNLTNFVREELLRREKFDSYIRKINSHEINWLHRRHIV
jgi:hypothetical protein